MRCFSFTKVTSIGLKQQAERGLYIGYLEFKNHSNGLLIKLKLLFGIVDKTENRCYLPT
ncbi:hypothetical protein FLB_22150 [Flavobacterium succinicans]|uniref:Uncharacterized protein n=1 Tax=Flavobacterium succinicans TaxID=29536 RepID=A0A199XQ93_9FLAO|nr:hypothetical protein FLB_22150 [Flavobacterium succinicans]